MLDKVKAIGVCGQMHGIVFWDEQFTQQFWNNGYEFEGQQFVSNLYTWQDKRTDSTFLEKLPKPHSHLKAYSGYGCITALWLNEHQWATAKYQIYQILNFFSTFSTFIHFRPDILRKYKYCGTIQDLIVSVLCNQQRPVMSTQNAASWGYFDTISCSWNVDVLSKVNFPLHLLPSVVQPGTNFGTLYDTIYDLPQGTVIGKCWN